MQKTRWKITKDSWSNRTWTKSRVSQQISRSTLQPMFMRLFGLPSTSTRDGATMPSWTEAQAPFCGLTFHRLISRCYRKGPSENLVGTEPDSVNSLSLKRQNMHC